MAFPWTALSFLFRVVAPSIPEVLTTINNLKSQQQQKTTDTTNVDVRLAEIDRALSLQLDLIDQLTKQLRELEKMIKKAITLAILALALALLSLGIFFFYPLP